MQTFKKWLPWILAVAAIALFVVYLQKYNKEKAKVLNVDNLTDPATTGGIAGGLVPIDGSMMATEIM